MTITLAQVDATQVVVVLLFAVLPAVLVEAATAVSHINRDAGNPQDVPSVPGWRTRGHA